MRKDVKKFLFVGVIDDKDYFFKRAQEIGIIHFIDSNTTRSKEVPEEIQNITASIKILRGLPPTEQEENFKLIVADEVIQSILRYQEEKEKCLEELRVLRLEIARVGVFGDFSLEDVAVIEQQGHRKVQFFCAKSSLFEDQPIPDELIYIASESGLDYYVAINPAPTFYDKMIEIKIDRPLGQLLKREEEVQNELKQADSYLKKYSKYNDFLHHYLVDKLNYYHLYTVQNYVQQAMDGMLFAIEGWVPENKINEMHEFLTHLNIYDEEVAIEPTDVVPTYLDNKGFNRLGEDLVHIYDTPSATDKDPSPWVMAAFTLFFAFIIGDAGYGLIFLAIAFYLRYKHPEWTGAKRRFVKMFTVLSIGCIGWGILTTSFFGMNVDPNNPIRKFSIVQYLAEKNVAYQMAHDTVDYQGWIKKYPELASMHNPSEILNYVPSQTPDQSPPILTRLSDATMFELALFIGVFHLSLSLLRYARRNLPSLGWVAFLVGGYLYIPFYLNAPSLLNYAFGLDLAIGGGVGLELIIGGIIFAVIASVFKHGFTGIFEIMSVIQLFADVLSYLRLYALGLAGAIVASTINEAASGTSPIIAFLLLFVSHSVNIVLGTMSGVVHGLRLNFLEWYRYSFEGGGKEFQPLKLLKME